MNEEESSTDWDNLIQKHLDGLTSEAEATKLSELIVNDGEIRSLYIKAAQLHGALADEVLALDLETPLSIINEEPHKEPVIRRFLLPQPIAVALIAGALVGLIGVGIVRAFSAPILEAKMIPVFSGDFDDSATRISSGFPTTFNGWSGEPAEVIEGADGNRALRFLETANVKGDPNGLASSCNVFQLIDLTSLQQQWSTENSEARVTLEFSARFRRAAAETDAALKKPDPRASCTIHLYKGDPSSIGKRWPLVIRDALSTGTKQIKLEPGESETISASCILDPEADFALISVNVNTMRETQTPIKLGGFYVDDVQLIATRQPNLPVRYVK